MAKKRHYSARLGRVWRDGDELTREEAAAVLSENSGRPIEPKYVLDLVRLNVVEPHKLTKRKFLYPYSAIKNYVVGSKAGKHLQENPASDSALRVRAFRARRRAAEDQKKMETSLAG